MQVVRAIYLAVGGQESLGVVGATGVRLLLSALVIGPPTFFMGGTLPAAARAVTGADEDGRGSLGWLYGLNTLGAVAGTLISTFFLLEWLGNRETIWLASAMNLANAGVIWWWSSVASVPASEQTSHERVPAQLRAARRIKSIAKPLRTAHQSIVER